MKPWISNVFSVSLVFMLASCGGGTSKSYTGISAYTDTYPYIGVWKGDCNFSSGVYWTNTLDLRANDATTISGVEIIQTYGSTNSTCSGAATSTASYPLVITLDEVGTGDRGSDKVTKTYETLTGDVIEKDYLLVSGNNLFTGDGTGTETDYPGALLLSPSYIKQ